METTTMDAAGSTGIPTTEVSAADAGSTLRPMLGALHQVWWFSLGLVVVAGEQTARLVKTAVARGKDVEPSVSGTFKKAGGGLSGALKGVGGRLGKGAEAVEGALDERIAAAMARAGVPIMTEMQQLKTKVEELTTKVETLQTKRERAERPSQH